MGQQMRVVLLAGGMGTRLQEETSARPKPMVEIGGKPILWHIMKHFAHYRCEDFYVALGYMGDFIKDYFLDRYNLAGNLSIDFAKGSIKRTEVELDRWNVNLVDTGLNTLTGGRLLRLKRWLGDETFMLTYGDGVSNVDLTALLAYHRRRGKIATVTAVRPPARFGGLSVEDGIVNCFTGDSWCSSQPFLTIWLMTPTVWKLTRSIVLPLTVNWPHTNTRDSGNAWIHFATNTTWNSYGKVARHRGVSGISGLLNRRSSYVPMLVKSLFLIKSFRTQQRFLDRRRQQLDFDSLQSRLPHKPPS